MLDIVLHDAAREIRLSEVARGSGCLKLDVGDLVPKNSLQVVETESPGPHPDIGGQRPNVMPPPVRSSDVHVPYDTADPAAGHQHAGALHPYLVELVEELVVVVDVAELARVPGRVGL